MMSKILIDEATVKLALEALEFEAKGWEIPPRPTLKAIEALAALAEQPAQQEPVYHLRQYGDVTKEQLDRYMATGDINPQPAQQEPVAYGMWDTMLGKDNRMMMVRLDKGQDGCTVPLYTAHGIKENT